MKIWFICLSILAITTSLVDAAPSSSHGSRYDQPDGTKTPKLFLHGDEHYSWQTDKKGYTVIRNEQEWYVYARKINGELVSSGIRVGYGNPKKLGLAKNLKTDRDKRSENGIIQMNQNKRDHRELLNIPSTAICSFEGSKDQPCRLRGLIVLIKFSDHRGKRLPDPEEYDILFNTIGGSNQTAPTGSVRDVFSQNSYGSFVLESIVYPEWIEVPRTEQITVAGNYGLNLADTRKTWRMALEIVQSKGFDFRQVDQVHLAALFSLSL